MRHLVTLVCILLLSASGAIAGGPPAETCGAGDSLSGADMMPQSSLAFTAAVDDFVLPAATCAEVGFDHVTCLTPTSGCTVDAACGVAEPRRRGLQVGVNVFQGSCTTSPTSCIDSDVGTEVGTITAVALTASTTYCFETCW